jgi:membrane-associated phospholipid phosphatase
MLVSFCLDRPMLLLVRWANVDSLAGDYRRTLESFKEFGQLVVWVVACLLIFLLDKPSRSKLLRLIFAIVLSFAVVWSIKLTVHRLRPHPAAEFDTTLGLGFYFGADPKLPVLRTSDPDKNKIVKHRPLRASEKVSFPSGHTATAFAFAVGLAALYPPARWVFYALAIGCGTHRILFDAHWFSDVVASLFIGILIARAVWRWRRV